MPTTVAVDWDGVLYDFHGNLNEVVIQGLVNLSNQGIEFIVWTCRVPETIKNQVLYMIGRGINIVSVNDVSPNMKGMYEVESRKVFAHKYIDDQMAGFDKISWDDIFKDILTYHLRRVAEGEIDMKGVPTSLKKEIKDYCKVLKDFGIEVTEAQKEEWSHMSPIRIENMVKDLIFQKLSGGN